jgi:hypothetical protein
MHIPQVYRPLKPSALTPGQSVYIIDPYDNQPERWTFVRLEDDMPMLQCQERADLVNAHHGPVWSSKHGPLEYLLHLARMETMRAKGRENAAENALRHCDA